jgi:hypothetical protein
MPNYRYWTDLGQGADELAFGDGGALAYALVAQFQLMQFQLHAPLPAVSAMMSHRKNHIAEHRPVRTAVHASACSSTPA